MDPIALQQLRNVLIQGKAPCKVVDVAGIACTFTFTDTDIFNCDTIVDGIEFLEEFAVCRTRNTIIPITSLPGVYFSSLHNAYAKFQLTMLDILLNNVKLFVESTESYGLWLTYTHSDPAYVLTFDRKLNIIQRRWVALNAMRAEQHKMEMLGDVFEAAKPWLDKDLYKALKEQENDETRLNAFYDDEAQDAQLREKARRMMDDTSETDGDIIVVEED